MADFAAASRQKVRFITDRGQLSVEDLWDLPLTSPTGKNVNLNDIAKSLFRDLKQSEEVDFVEDVKKPSTMLQLKFDLVKHVIEVKKTERDAAAKEQERKAEIQKLLEIIGTKENEELRGKSLDELRAKIRELQK